MAQRGRPRKGGKRQPDGSLRSSPGVDRGHELTLAHRAQIIAGADPKDQRASYPLGILALRGDLADPDADKDEAEEQNHLRHQAGLIYAGLHAIVHGGNKTPRSHLGSAIAGLSEPLSDLTDTDRDTIYRRSERRLRAAVAHVLIHGGRALHVLENTVVYEQGLRFMDTSNRRPPSAWEADARDTDCLRLALADCVQEFKLEPRKPGSR